jgi:tight adherence protein B
LNWNLITFGLLLATAAALFVFGVRRFFSSHWGADATKIKHRLHAMNGDMAVRRNALVKKRVLSSNERFDAQLQRIPRITDLDVFVRQAGLSLNVGQFVLCCAALWLLSTWCAGLLGAPLWLAVLWGVAPTVLWLLWLQHKRRKRVFDIEAQLPETLDLIARAMQAGHAFSSALLIVGSEGPNPIREEFQTTFDEINFGIPTETALQHLTQRVASHNLQFFVVAVLIQLETGGNLTELLKTLSTLIRDRRSITSRVRVLTAEGRLSAWILGVLPFGIGLLLAAINPEFISKLWTDPMGIRMLQVSLALMAVGVWWMWRMVRIKI